MKDFQPKILGFLCNWCSYAGADLAGVSRIQYPPNFRAIRVMCSGRVDPSHIVTSFRSGWDGVMVLGCHFGDCHYISGNYEAENKVQAVHLLLQEAGIDPGRLYVDWVSAGEGQKFAALIDSFTEKMTSLGPLGKKEKLDPDVMSKRLAAAKHAAESERIRWLTGRKKQLLTEENVMDKAIEESFYDQLLHDAVVMEYRAQAVVNCLEDSPLSVKELSTELSLSKKDVLSLVVELKHRNLVAFHSIEGKTPRYIAVTA
jgi:coenzyme F420-reducing hydrogenase delta subunit